MANENAKKDNGLAYLNGVWRQSNIKDANGERRSNIVLGKNGNYLNNVSIMESAVNPDAEAGKIKYVDVPFENRDAIKHHFYTNKEGKRVENKNLCDLELGKDGDPIEVGWRTKNQDGTYTRETRLFTNAELEASHEAARKIERELYQSRDKAAEKETVNEKPAKKVVKPTAQPEQRGSEVSTSEPEAPSAEAQIDM